jgi:hypothetical protein
MGEHKWIYDWFFGVPLWGVPIALVPWLALQLLRKRWRRAMAGTIAVAAAWTGSFMLWLSFGGLGCFEGCAGRAVTTHELFITVVYGVFGYATVLWLYIWGSRAYEA